MHYLVNIYSLTDVLGDIQLPGQKKKNREMIRNNEGCDMCHIFKCIHASEGAPSFMLI